MVVNNFFNSVCVWRVSAEWKTLADTGAVVEQK